jgi:hypothetical protein
MQRIMRDNEKARQEKFLLEKQKADTLAAAEQECPPAKRLTIEEQRVQSFKEMAAKNGAASFVPDGRWRSQTSAEVEEREAKLRSLPGGSTRQPMFPQ